jgi:hypothetical protein
MQPRLKKMYKPEHLAQVDHVLAQPPGSKRWRAAAALWLNVNPWINLEDGSRVRARIAAAEIMRQNREERSMQTNAFATSDDKNSGLRNCLSFPPGLLEAIELFDYHIFADKDTSKRNLHQLMKTFPEWTIPEKI